MRINQTRERVANSPAYDPNLTEMSNREVLDPYYDYYGYAPYWGAGPMSPGLGYPLI